MRKREKRERESEIVKERKREKVKKKREKNVLKRKIVREEDRSMTSFSHIQANILNSVTCFCFVF